MNILMKISLLVLMASCASKPYIKSELITYKGDVYEAVAK